MERNIFLQGCLVFLFLSTGNIEISENGNENVKNEIPRSFPNRRSVHDDSRYCRIDPRLLFPVKSSKQHIDNMSENLLVDSIKTEYISMYELLQKEYDSSLVAEHRENEMRHLKYKDFHHSVKEMTLPINNHQKIYYGMLKKPELHACRALFQYHNINGKQEECQYFFENRTITSSYIDQPSSGTMKIRLKYYDKSIPDLTKISSISSLCPTESIAFQIFSSTQPPVINGFYSDPPDLHTLAKNNTSLENDLVLAAEDQRATPAIGIADNTMMYVPAPHEITPATSLASTLEGSFSIFTSRSSELGSYNNFALLSSSEGCQETSSMESTPAMGPSSISSESFYSSATGGSGVNNYPGSQLSASNDMYTSRVSRELSFTGSDYPGIIYPSPCASDSSSESSEVFSLYGFVDIYPDIVEY